MKNHLVRVHSSKEHLKKKEQLAWKMAEIASSYIPLDKDVLTMIKNRIIDNAAVSIASINRQSVLSARAQAIQHKGNSCLFGLDNNQKVSPEWASWANEVAVRELDYHDTFLAADYSHPGDNIPSIIAVAQNCNLSGKNITMAIVIAYELQVSLVKAICLHKHKIDHIAHLGPANAAALGTLLNLPTEIIYQSIQQALHVTCTTRQSRKGLISSWKAYAPAHAVKMAVEAVDRAMRGETSPTPIYEGEDSVIAWMLGGSKELYNVLLVDPQEKKRLILETYPKAYSAEYQSQALIDLAFRMRKQLKDFNSIKKIIIHTSHHTHYVIGSGANDPEKFDPLSSRETLDHSIMYIFAVALQDGYWHHITSYLPERSQRKDTVSLWHKIETCENKKWSDLYHNIKNKSFGGKVEIFFKNGNKLVDEIMLADAHPQGKNPWQQKDYSNKFILLTKDIVSATEQKRFLSLVEKLENLSPKEVAQLNVQVDAKKLKTNSKKGIFDY
jgi:2-methylcitrate dehydratase